MMRRFVILGALLTATLVPVGCSKAEKKAATTTENTNAPVATATPAGDGQTKAGASPSSTPAQTGSSNTTARDRGGDDRKVKNSNRAEAVRDEDRDRRDDDERGEAEDGERGRDADDRGRPRSRQER